MTSANAARKPSRCAFCRGSLARRRADISLPTPSGLLWLRGVPALVCGDCEEPFLHGQVLDRVLEIARNVDALSAEVSVLRYKAA